MERIAPNGVGADGIHLSLEAHKALGQAIALEISSRFSDGK